MDSSQMVVSLKRWGWGQAGIWGSHRGSVHGDKEVWGAWALVPVWTLS